MKPKLNPKDQKRQAEIRRALAEGAPLTGVFSNELMAGATPAEPPTKPKHSTRRSFALDGTSMPFDREVAMPRKQTVRLQGVIARPTPRRGEHVVVQGETLAGIAEAYQTTVDVLIWMNNLADPDGMTLKAGQKLCVPLVRGKRNAH